MNYAHEQAYALGNLLDYLKESEVIDLYNEVFKGNEQIYKVENLNKDFADVTPKNMARAASYQGYDFNSRLDFDFDKPYFKTEIVSQFGEQFTIFVSVDKKSIDFAELAESVFDGRELPENVKELFNNSKAVEEYQYELAEYLAEKSGSELEKAYTFAVKQNPLGGWFNIYCNYVGQL